MGILKGLSIDEDFTYIDVGNVSIAFRNGSDEAIYLEENVDDTMVGRRIGILRTDMAGKTLIVRVIDRQTGPAGLNAI